MDDSVRLKYIKRDGADTMHSCDATSGSDSGAIDRSQIDEFIALIADVIGGSGVAYDAMSIVLPIG